MKSYFEKKSGSIQGFGLRDFLEKCKDGLYEISIKKVYKNRSLEQNKYYWGVIIGDKDFGTGLVGFLGYEPEEIHEILRERFLTIKLPVPTDKRRKLKRTRSTTELTTVEFEEYCENIRIWAQLKLNFYIPKPNEYANYEGNGDGYGTSSVLPQE